MTIQLTPDQERFIQSKVQAGQYQSAEDVIATALRLLEDYDNSEAHWLESIRPAIDAAYESTEPAIDGSTFVNQLRQRLKTAKQR
jgi:antitoxin ParD1/3/4